MVITRTTLSLLLSLAVVAATSGCDVGPVGGDDDDSAAGDDDDGAPEPLDLPDDPAATGVPVGVLTTTVGELTVEVWYPASEATAGQPTESIDVGALMPAAVVEVLGEIDLPVLETIAVRDAALRVPEQPYPVVLFAHGFGGFRLQSVDYTTHLASRGYVVVAADHTLRTFGDVLPCLFSPQLEGCDSATFIGEDPTPDHLASLLTWIETANDQAGGVFEGALDVGHVAVTGHGGGGIAASSVGDDHTAVTAVLAMGGAGDTARDVPVLLLGGGCDALFTMEQLEDVQGATADATLVDIEAAGHLAFTDMCAIDLAGFAEEYLAPRDDMNEMLVAQLMQLTVDGCPGLVPDPPPAEECADDYLALETSTPIVRHYATVFIDQQLRGTGPGVVAGVFPEADVR
jgi:dienelactone hydrolase